MRERMTTRYVGRIQRGALLFLACLLAGAAHADVTYKYDDLNRLVLVKYDATNMIHYAYDKCGNITNVVTIGSDQPDLDSDGDTLPDRWELDYFTDLDENAAGDYNSDTRSNGWEYANGTDPTDPDTDNDGMPNVWEAGYALNPLTNDAAGDMDGDGGQNLQEYVAGTVPTNPASVLKITDMARVITNTVLTWSSVSNRYYRIQSTLNLTSSWSNVPEPDFTNAPGTGAAMKYTNSQGAPVRFFRVKVRKP